MEKGKVAAGGLSAPMCIVFIVFHALLGVAVLAAGRLAMFYAFAHPDDLHGRAAEVTAMWRVGLRYDLRVIAMGLAPLALLGIAACARRRLAPALNAVQKYYSPAVYFTLVMTACIGFYYYQTFRGRIDAFVFGFVDDDTSAIMTSILHDYPLLAIAGLVSAVTLFCAWTTRRVFLALLRHSSPSPGVVASSVALALFVFAYAVACRGSIGVFPLRQNDSRVSDLSVLNDLAPNGIISFSWAWKQYRESAVYAPVSERHGKELALKATGRDTLWNTTRANAFLEENPPHVVMVMLESFGSNFLRFDRPDSLDLLGSLRRHTEEDFYFQRFASEENGTMPSLAALALSCPDQTITQGVHQRARLDGTVFATYKAHGYETVFIFPGRGSWRNIAPYLTAQGTLDRFYDLNNLVAEYPASASQEAAWGLPDEYAFCLAQRLLSESGRPLFIFILTVTNHSPYELPGHYRPHALNPDAATLEKLDAKDAVKMRMLESAQYTNTCIGDFIAAVKRGALRERTIIAATGDHHMRDVESDVPEGSFLSVAVPFYLYLPAAVREHTSHCFDPMRPGSHKDIMPTLYAHSLSGASYYSVGGRDMLADNDDPECAFGYNVRWMFDRDGAVAVDAAEGFPFADATRLAPDSYRPSPRFLEKMRAFTELRRWQINMRVAGLRE